jgi:hypothetical protein
MNPYMMNNPYLGMPIDYGQGTNMQPTYQNIGAQQSMQNAAMQEQNNQVQQAGMIGQQAQGTPQQQALAKALRNRNEDPYAQTAMANKQYGANNVYSQYGGGGTVPAYVTDMNAG